MARFKETTCGHPTRQALESCVADRTLFCDDCGREIVRLAFKEGAVVVGSPLRRFTAILPEDGRLDPRTATPRALHGLLQATGDDGLDFYCPVCDALYCEAHYLCHPVWDDGFYDYTEATCPAGHERIMDD